MSWQKAIILNPNEQVLHSWEGNCERQHKAVVKAFIGHKTVEAKERAIFDKCIDTQTPYTYKISLPELDRIVKWC